MIMYNNFSSHIDGPDISVGGPTKQYIHPMSLICATKVTSNPKPVVTRDSPHGIIESSSN